MVRDSVSLPHGVVTLTEAELHSDPPRPEELANAISIVSDAVDNAVIERPALGDTARVVAWRAASSPLRQWSWGYNASMQHDCTRWCFHVRLQRTYFVRSLPKHWRTEYTIRASR